MSLSRPVSIVTGAGSGIGRATAILLGRSNHRVVLAGRQTERLEETASELETECLVQATDVSDPRSVQHLIERAHEHFGRIDNLVNNAGFAPSRPIEKTTPDLLRRVFEVNAFGPAYAIIAVFPIFREQGGGCIVNVSSMASVDPFPGFFAYAAAKAATNVMVQSCHNEGKAFAIRSFSVAPGAVETEMLRSNFDEGFLPREKVLDPMDVARVIVACIQGERREENGKTILVPSPEL